MVIFGHPPCFPGSTLKREPFTLERKPLFMVLLLCVRKADGFCYLPAEDGQAEFADGKLRSGNPVRRSDYRSNPGH
jgi:hypothetical protein